MPNNEAPFEDSFDFDILEDGYAANSFDEVAATRFTRPRPVGQRNVVFDYPDQPCKPEVVSDPLDIDDKECQVQVCEPVSLRSTALWMEELVFGRVVHIHRDLVREAVEGYPQHDMAIRRWWKVYQKIRSKPNFGADSFDQATKESLLGDALKFDQFYHSQVSTMTLQLGDRIFQLTTDSDEDVPQRFLLDRRKFSIVHPGAEIHIDRGNSSPVSDAWSQHHKGEIYAISAIISGEEIIAAGPFQLNARLDMIDRGGAFQATQIKLSGTKSSDHQLIHLIDPARRRNVCIQTKEFSVDVGSPMHARLTEAAAFYGEGNRSIIHVGVVFSDSYVTFIKPSPSFLTKLKFEMPDVPWIVFEQQLKTIETEATRRVEQKLLAACYNFLGERQGEPLGHEEQAIVDTLFELMKPRHVTHGLQDGWDQLCRRGIKTYAALLAIEESWGVTLLEEPCDNPDQVSSEVEEDAKVA